MDLNIGTQLMISVEIFNLLDPNFEEILALGKIFFNL